MSTQALLADIEAFLARNDVKISETTFGRLAVNDGKFVSRLRNGGGLTLATAEKAREFMAHYEPAHRTSGEPRDEAAA